MWRRAILPTRSSMLQLPFCKMFTFVIIIIPIFKHCFFGFRTIASDNILYYFACHVALAIGEFERITKILPVACELKWNRAGFGLKIWK